MKLEPHQVIIIQISASAHSEITKELEAQGLTEDENYLFFNRFDHDVLDHIEPGIPQLVFTSHANGCDAETVADGIKGKNPQAFVVALTSCRVSNSVRAKLDGVFDKFHLPEHTLARIIHNFLSGADRKKILTHIGAFSSQPE